MHELFGICLELSDAAAYLFDARNCFLDELRHLGIQRAPMLDFECDGIQRMSCLIEQIALLSQLVTQMRYCARIDDYERIGIITYLAFYRQAHEHPDVIACVEFHRISFIFQLHEIRLVEAACDRAGLLFHRFLPSMRGAGDPPPRTEGVKARSGNN